jgi:hypothetical protein
MNCKIQTQLEREASNAVGEFYVSLHLSSLRKDFF